MDTISEQQILDAIRRLPFERWPEVLQYLTNLPAVARENGTSPIRTAADLLNSDLVGIWAERTDIGGSREFAQRLRRQAESRRGQSDPT